jgi:uncharacterized metal-binding protein
MVKILPICAKEAENLNIILACDGASNVGQVGHQAAVELTNNGEGRMCCITAVGANSKVHVDIMRRAKRLVAINGCENRCTEKVLEKLHLNSDFNIVVSELGVEKQPTLDFKEEDVKKVVQRIQGYLKER